MDLLLSALCAPSGGAAADGIMVLYPAWRIVISLSNSPSCLTHLRACVDSESVQLLTKRPPLRRNVRFGEQISSPARCEFVRIS